MAEIDLAGVCDQDALGAGRVGAIHRDQVLLFLDAGAAGQCSIAVEIFFGGLPLVIRHFGDRAAAEQVIDLDDLVVGRPRPTDVAGLLPIKAVFQRGPLRGRWRNPTEREGVKV